MMLLRWVSGLSDLTFVYGIFFEQGDDECGSGYGDEGAYDTGQCCANEQGDEYGEAHEVYAALHDAGDEDCVLDVDVEEIEEEDAEHAGPRVEGRHSGGEDDGDDASGDGNDVEEAHEDAQQQEVAHMQESEGSDGTDAEDEHEETLSVEPLAHLDFCFAQGDVEPMARGRAEEGKEEVVGVLAFEHEVDAEEGGGEDIDEVREPVWQRGDEVSGGGGDGGFCALGEGVDAEFIGHGEPLEAGDDGGDALGKFGGELAEVAEDGG